MAPVEADQERLIEDEVTEVTARFCGASGAVAELGGGGGGEEVEEVGTAHLTPVELLSFIELRAVT